MIKPGYRTSEFWFTLVSFIFSGLYLVGILKENEQKDQLIEIVSHAVESTILISGQILILYKYIKGRNEVKKVANNKTMENDNDSERANSGSSRKKQSTSKKSSSKSKKNSSK